MKRIGLAIFLGLFGCTGKYQAERLFFKAERLKVTIMERPETTPPVMYDQARQAFQEVSDRFPKSPQAPKADLAVAERLPVDARQRRHEINMAALRKNDLGVWRDTFLRDLRSVPVQKPGKDGGHK